VVKIFVTFLEKYRHNPPIFKSRALVSATSLVITVLGTKKSQGGLQSFFHYFMRLTFIYLIKMSRWRSAFPWLRFVDQTLFTHSIPLSIIITPSPNEKAVVEGVSIIHYQGCHLDAKRTSTRIYLSGLGKHVQVRLRLIFYTISCGLQSSKHGNKTYVVTRKLITLKKADLTIHTTAGKISQLQPEIEY